MGPTRAYATVKFLRSESALMSDAQSDGLLFHPCELALEVAAIEEWPARHWFQPRGTWAVTLPTQETLALRKQPWPARWPRAILSRA